MNSENHSARDDLAFLRALAEGGGESQRGTGIALVLGGLLYGLQCFVAGAQAYGWVHLGDVAMTVFSIEITVVFLLAISWLRWLGRNAPRGGVVARALSAAFAAAGTATLSMLCVFASVAIRDKSLTIWLLYPMTLAVVLGSAWYVASMIRRRPWLLAVSIGWYATAMGLALLNRHPARYTLVLGAALLGLMAVPGAFMMRAGRASR